MVTYRRNFIPAASYFFTVTLLNRSSSLLVDRIDELKDAISSVRVERPFQIDAMVVLPDHIHAIWTLPPGDADYSIRWREIKSHFSRQLPKVEDLIQGRINKGERGIWQRRFWEHTLRDEVDVARHIDYIHYNPVKHGHVKQVVEWPYSSFHKYARQGLYPKDWGGSGDDESFTYRE